MCPELSNDIELLEYNCPICDENCISKNYTMTLVGYFSPPGHDHDDNCRKFYFNCKNNHSFSVRVRNICSVVGCDWKGKESCECHSDNPIIQ